MPQSSRVDRRKALKAASALGIGVLSTVSMATASEDDKGQKGKIAKPQLETFRAPPNAKMQGSPPQLQIAAVSSIVGVASHTFEFRENSNTPGRLLEQSVVVTVPPGAGFFTVIPFFTAAFTNSDFTKLGERPLGQLFASIGLRGNNLVCQVRLTDSNSDDPIFIAVTGIVVFYQ
jgi:hypothetical protein